MSSIAIGLIPGTFNPVHDGHLAICEYVLDQLEAPVPLISTKPFDKTLDNSVSESARLQFVKLGIPCMLVEHSTLAGQLLEIQKYYPLQNVSFTFNIGIDTLARLNDLKYYQSEKAFQLSLRMMRGLNLYKIRAFPRNGIDEIEVRPELKPLVEFIKSFKQVNISSTEIREKQNAHNSSLPQ